MTLGGFAIAGGRVRHDDTDLNWREAADREWARELVASHRHGTLDVNKTWSL